VHTAPGARPQAGPNNIVSSQPSQHLLYAFFWRVRILLKEKSGAYKNNIKVHRKVDDKNTELIFMQENT
jgi:hypothetical protein